MTPKEKKVWKILIDYRLDKINIDEALNKIMDLVEKK